jgi:hypothetical protein
MIYDLQALGAKNDGNPANCANNTAVFLRAEQDARGGNPGPIEIGMGAGMCFLNGKLKLNGPNMIVRGLGGMGAEPDWGPTSTIRGFGAGHTLDVLQGGCRVQGLAWQGDSQGEKDAFIRISQTQCMVRDHWMDSPQTGILLDFPFNMGGQAWFRDIEIVGTIKQCAMDINGGGAAVRLDHVIAFNGTMKPEDPQPAYGIKVRAAGELMLAHLDIDNCGTNLGIVPGIDGVADTYVQDLEIVNSDFDNGNGAGQILIQPWGTSFFLNGLIDNAWGSSVNNGLDIRGKNWPANGITVDGTKSRPRAGFPAICNVSLANSVMQNSVGHCGGYFNTVTGLSVVNCGAWNNAVGFQTFNCNGVITACKAGNYMPRALGTTFVGNLHYGILLEKSPFMRFNPLDNALDGNGVAPYFIKP